MIETGNISSFEDMFNVIPRSIVATDLGVNYNRFLDKLKNLQDFTFREIVTLSTFINVDNEKLVSIVLTDINKKKIVKRKK